MQKDDLVYAGHMLDTARKATSKVVGQPRDEFDRDENLAFGARTPDSGLG